jgi:DNA-directed RNA polymerase specialized sigma54-like protein
MAPRDELERYEATEAEDLTCLLRALRPPERAVQVPPPVDLTIRAEIWKAQVRRQVIALLSMARRDFIQVIRQALTDNPMLEEVAPAEDEHASAGEEHVPHLTAAADDPADAEERYDSIWQACVPDGWDAHDLPSQASEAPSASERPSGSPEALVPDVIVMKVGHDDQVFLNEEGMPRLRLSATSRHWVREGQGGEPEATQYLDDKLRAAVWLIRSLEHRRQTLLKVATSLVQFQRDFLDHGLAYLKPLVLKDVAEDIGMHESTVSRVTTSKYMYTEQGIFELKYFFHSGIELYGGGETMSSLTVKDRIKKLVAAEDPGKPLTDQQLVEMLAAEYVKIARRTVTKYRCELKLPPANRRHQQHGSAARGAGPAAGASQLSPDEAQRVRQALEAHTRRRLTEPPPLGDREEASGVPPEVDEAQRHRYLA